MPASEPVRLVLECDGTQVEDGEYFRTLSNNTVLLLLRQGERWYPAGVDVIKAGKYIFAQFNNYYLKTLTVHCASNNYIFVIVNSSY